MSVVNVENLPEDVASRIKNVYNHLKLMNESSDAEFFYKVSKTDVTDPSNPDFVPFIVRGNSLMFHYPGKNYNHCDILEKHQRIWFWTDQVISEYNEETFLSSKVEFPLDFETAQHNNEQLTKRDFRVTKWTHDNRQWKLVKVIAGIEYYTVTDPSEGMRICIALVRGQVNTHFPKIYKRLAKEELSFHIDRYRMSDVDKTIISLLTIVDPVAWVDSVRNGKIKCNLSFGFRDLHMQMDFNDKTRGFSMNEIKNVKNVRRIQIA